MNASTNILDLPVDPVVPVSGNGISLTANENVAIQQASQNAEVTLDQTTINQIVSSLQQASQNGYTQLPSRDIPITTTGYNNDPQVQPNYVPPPTIPDYIQNVENPEEIIRTYNTQVKNSTSLDNAYNEIQTPLLLAVLYFLFQLPFFQKFLFDYIPILFKTDGNLNINGLLFKSFLFGLIFYLLNKLSNFAPF